MEAASAIVELKSSDLASLPAPDTASITDVKHLSSYNWIEAREPTIAVPGCPLEWIHLKNCPQVEKDCGHYYIAQNNARHPEFPLEPLFRSIYETSPTFDVRAIDVVSDRDNFRKLLSFIQASDNPDGAKLFTIKVEVVGKTALFNREEKKVEYTIRPYEFRGFGHNFEKASTKDTIKNSTGHHRIVSYRFGDLRVVIRYETDGYDPKTLPTHTPSEDESLSQMMSSLSFSASEAAAEGYGLAETELAMVKEGHLVPPASVLEIKTRSANRPMTATDVAAQLWVSQTPKLVLAHYRRDFAKNGRVIFDTPEVEDVTDVINTWEKDNQTALKKLAALIVKIRDVARQSPRGKVEVKYLKGSDRLTIEPCDEDLLPEDLYEKWEI